MRYIGKDAASQIPDPMHRWVEKRVTATARGIRVAESIFPVRQLPGGVDARGWRTDRSYILAKRGASHPGPIVSTELTTTEDTVGFQKADVELLYIIDGFAINADLLSASRLAGMNLSLRAPQTIGLEVAEKLETVLFQGIDTPEQITGFDEGATDSGASAGAWSTRANVITDIDDLITLVRDTGKYTGPRWLLVTGPLMTDLMILENDYTDRVLLDTLARLFPLGIYEIQTSFLEATETALVGCPGANTPEADLTNFEIVRAAPITTQTTTDAFGDGLRGRIYCKMSPVIHQSAALGEKDNITA
jgi:hypothetical protein